MCGVHSATSRSRKAKERRLRPLIRPRMSHGGRSADARIWGQTRSLGWSRRDMGTDTKFNLHACQNMGTDTESGLVTTRYGDRHEVQPPRLPEYGDRHEVWAGHGAIWGQTRSSTSSPPGGDEVAQGGGARRSGRNAKPVTNAFVQPRSVDCGCAAQRIWPIGR
jgi:hypothetical protein